MSETRHRHHVRFHHNGTWFMIRVTTNPNDFRQSQALIKYLDAEDEWKVMDPTDVQSFGQIVFLDTSPTPEDWYR